MILRTSPLPTALFSRWSLGRADRPAARPPRRTSRARLGRVGHWEQLGLGLGSLEQLEGRALMAADIDVSLHDNIGTQIERIFYAPGSQVIYTLTVENKGDATATDAALKTTLASGITAKTWTAAYSGNGTGAQSGTGDIDTKLTLPANAKAVFTIVCGVGASATGDLVSSATVTAVAGETVTANNTDTDTDTFVPRSIAVGQAAGWGGSSVVRLVNPTTGATIAETQAFPTNSRTGTAVAVGDLDGDGKFEVVVATKYGVTGEIAVLRQDVSAGGVVTLVKDVRYSLQPFGAGFDRGLNLAVGDFDGDHRDDIAVSRAFGVGTVNVYRSTGTPADPLALFRSFTAFPGVLGGASLAAGEFDHGTFFGGSGAAIAGAGKSQLVVSSGMGSRAVVRVYDVSATTPAVLDTILPLGRGFLGGATVSVARVNADATPDIIVSSGVGGGSVVEVYDGTVAAATANRRLARFAAFSGLANRNAAVAAVGVDSDGDGLANRIDVVQSGAGTAALESFTTAGVRQGGVAGLAGALQVAGPIGIADASFTKTASGLLYREIVKGTGKSPTSDSANVKVNYEGRLLNGTRFDGNKGTSFALNGVIKGWTEGLKTMAVGGRTQFVIPADLAYGATGQGSIPPNATLVFDVELLSTT